MANNGNGESRRSDRKWYKDRIYIFIIGVFVIAAILLALRAEDQTRDISSAGNEQALLVGTNKTLSGINTTILIVNKTALVVNASGPAFTPPDATLDDIKQLLVSVNDTLSNPKPMDVNSSAPPGVRDLLESVNNTLSNPKIDTANTSETSGVRDLLEDVNQTLSDPNRTLNMKPS